VGGGGNAGECFEVLIRGLEVATLVFMHYEVREGSYVELPIRIVDTGYGLERIYWLSTGEPNVYEATFREFLDRIRRLTGIPKLSPDIAKIVSIHLGQLEPEVLGLSKAYEVLASRVGMSVEELRQLLIPQETLYVLADHSRTVTWMLADGVVPSNTGVGYLARLLIRRMLRSMYASGIEMRLADVFYEHFKSLRREYPEIKESETTALELVELEERKFKEVLSSAPLLVERIARESERRSGKKVIDSSALIDLYDSHGVPPEVVKSIADRLGVEVELPDDFYSKLAERHLRPARGEEGRAPLALSDVVDLPRTLELFYEDPYAREFKGRVLRVLKGKFVVLDKTLFYPEGGGQPADVGVIRHSRGEAKVVDVQRVGHVIVHVVEGVPPEEGEEVVGVIDWDRRYALMKMHTGTHILIQSIRRVLGRHIWQAGAQKDIPISRLDVTHYKLPSRDEVKKIEELANSVIQSGLPVNVYTMPRNEAERRYGFVIYQGGVVPAKDLRVVSIGLDEPYDVQACGGTHLRNVGEIGLLKIVKVEKIADGVVRFLFTTGNYALRYVQELEEELDAVANLLGTRRGEVVGSVSKVLQEKKSLESLVKRYMAKAAKYDAMGVEVEEVRGVKLAFLSTDESDEYVQTLAKSLYSRVDDVVLVVLRSDGRFNILVGPRSKVNGGELARRIVERLGGKGGGSRTMGQGVTTAKSIEEIKNIIGELI